MSDLIMRLLTAEFPKANIVLTGSQLVSARGWLIRWETDKPASPPNLDYWEEYDCVGFAKFEDSDLVLEWYHVLAETKHGVLPEENIGSCEPSPLIQWDKTQSTWHTDVDKVGRYSIRRPGKRMPYEAYLNNNNLRLMPTPDVDVLKRSIERRIREATRINEVTEAPKDDKAPLHTRRPTFGKRESSGY